MSNNEKYIKLMEISFQMDNFLKEKKYEERNRLVPIWRELYRSYDFGFKVGEIVLSNAWSKSWIKARVVEHDTIRNQFLITDHRSWSVWVSGYLLRKDTPEKLAEQINMFELLNC